MRYNRTVRTRLLALALLFAASTTHGAGSERFPTDEKFCKALGGYLQQAANGFKDLKGSALTPPKDGKAAQLRYLAKTRLPYAHACTVYEKDADNEAFVTCDFTETKDPKVATVSYQKLVAKVVGCMPADWTSDKGEHEDGSGQWFTFTRADASLPFIDVNDDVQPDGYHLINLDVIVPK